jgi:hypothetical protein
MASARVVALQRIAGIALFLILAASADGFGAANESPKAGSEQLIARAAQAEIAGEIAKSADLRREAVQADRNNRLAHWQLGEVEAGKQWVKVEEAQQRAAGDRQLAEYKRLRAAAGDRFAGQLDLAKWCRKNGLLDEARFHWANVLTADPNNVDAQRALDVRWYHGRILSTSEIASLRKAENVRKREQLADNIAKWRRAFDGKETMSLAEALEQIRAVDDPEAILPIEELTEHPESNQRQVKQGALTNEQIELRHRIGVAYLAMISGMADQAATEALVRQAVWSSFSDIREESALELKKRPMYDYVPILLAGLELPIESTYQVQTSSDGRVSYVHTLYRPGAASDQSEVLVDSAAPYFTQPLKTDSAGRPFDPGRAARVARNSPKQVAKFARKARVVEANVAVNNEVTADRNQRIVAALTTTTDQKLGDDPRGWWTYWKDHNEYYTPPKQPVYQQIHQQNENYCCSCFVKGTLIWTKTGRRPVESLEIGDLVLSQNVDTGELRYEPVIGRTVRPPSQILKVSFDGDEIEATKGHPFWVAGIGWRMTKELQDGAILCGLNRAARVSSIKPAGEAEAYNLIVAEFSTYFVGNKGLLVHDNTPRRPTRVAVPGVTIAAK